MSAKKDKPESPDEEGQPVEVGGPAATQNVGGPTPDTTKKLKEMGRRVPDAGGVKIGDLVNVKTRPGTAPSDAVYRVRDVSHDKGRLFASVENYPDTSAGVFGSFHIDDLEPDRTGAADRDGPGGHPPPTEDQRKAAEAATEQRRRVDEDAAKALDAEQKRAEQERDRQRGDLKHARRGHHE